jgi:hypothetical protein
MNIEIDLLPMSTWKIKLRWHELPLGMKALSIIAVVSWAVFGSLLLTVGYIETVALTQPATPDLIFSHPHEIKGSVRFLTDLQNRVYTTVRSAMILAFAITGILFYAYNRMNDRLEREHKQRLMDRITVDFELSQ